MRLYSPEGMDAGVTGFNEVPITHVQRQPILLMALGRGRVGKTVLLNAVVQYFRPKGADIRVWNIDAHNASHSLGVFHSDAMVPAHEEIDERRHWLERQMMDQSAQRYDVVLDVGGGDIVLSQLAKDLDLVTLFERQGIRPVVMHVIGPDKADLDYLRRVLDQNGFMPEATLIVGNAGLVKAGRSAEALFDDLIKDKTVEEAMKDGAEFVKLPVLTCMDQVINRGLTFDDAAHGRIKPGQEVMSFFDQERVSVWWTKAMPEFFKKIPSSWMPAVPPAFAPAAK